MNASTVMEVGATQFVGSQSQQPVLLQQPPFEVVGKQVFKRAGRGRETEYLIRFIGCVVSSLSSPLPLFEGAKMSLSFQQACIEACQHVKPPVRMRIERCGFV